MSTTEATSNTRLFLTRGLVAIAWAAVFAAVSDSVTTGVTVGAAVLLVPSADRRGRLVIDARGQRGSARQLLLAPVPRSALSPRSPWVWPRPGASGMSSPCSAFGPPSAVQRSSWLPCAAVRC